MVDALVSALEHAPERLDPVGVGHPGNKFSYTVADARVVEGHALVSGWHRPCRPSRRRAAVSATNFCRVLASVVLHNRSLDLISFSILRPNNGGLADSPATGLDLPTLVLVALACRPRKCFVDLDRPGEQLVVAFPRLANALEHEPGSLLRPHQDRGAASWTGDALEARQVQVDRDDPLAQRKAGLLEHGTGANAEALLAVLAPERVQALAWLCFDRPAPRAMSARRCPNAVLRTIHAQHLRQGTCPLAELRTFPLDSASPVLCEP